MCRLNRHTRELVTTGDYGDEDIPSLLHKVGVHLYRRRPRLSRFTKATPPR